LKRPAQEIQMYEEMERQADGDEEEGEEDVIE
jgi:hypothetical protein